MKTMDQRFAGRHQRRQSTIRLGALKDFDQRWHSASHPPRWFLRQPLILGGVVWSNLKCRVRIGDSISTTCMWANASSAGRMTSTKTK